MRLAGVCWRVLDSGFKDANRLVNCLLVVGIAAVGERRMPL